MSDNLWFTGLKLTESVYAVKKGTPYTVRRSWRARLLSRPWRPWVATETITPMVPAALQTPFGIIAHPAVIADLKRTFGVTDHIA